MIEDVAVKYKIDQTLRNQAFYLIKKYTSYRILDIVYQLNKEFLDAFERQLRHPSATILDSITEHIQERHEKEYLKHLYVLDNEEKSLVALLKLPYKNEAYSFFFEGGIKGTIFGRYGDEKGLEEDIFYQELGLGHAHGYIYKPYDHSLYVEKLLFSSEIGGLAGITLYESEYNIPNKHEPIYIKWSYESLFSESYWPLVKKIVEPIEICPIYNENSQNEIAPGEEITISGIYEPWFELPVYEKLINDPNYNPHVGCPNYFLNGAIATRYKLEGTEDWYDVKWRLIWEDKRYLDGTIPEEEKAYIFDLEHIGVNNTQHYDTEKLSVPGGLPCPKEGYWYTLAQENSRQYFKQNEVFPEILKNAWGKTIWYLEVTNKSE